MAINLVNVSVCSFCGKIMGEEEKLFSFPSLIQNIKDPLYKFNDSSFHLICILLDPLGEKAMSLANELISKTRPVNRICEVAKTGITNVDDYLFFDLLTSNEQEELYKFNFRTFDINNLCKWQSREEFIATASEFKRADKWEDYGEFKYLDYLVMKVRASC